MSIICRCHKVSSLKVSFTPRESKRHQRKNDKHQRKISLSLGVNGPEECGDLPVVPKKAEVLLELVEHVFVLYVCGKQYAFGFHFVLV